MRQITKQLTPKEQQAVIQALRIASETFHKDMNVLSLSSEDPGVLSLWGQFREQRKLADRLADLFEEDVTLSYTENLDEEPITTEEQQ